MTNKGYIALHRKLRDNFLWKQRRSFSMVEAWIDMLMEAQHSSEPQKVVIGMTVLTCHRGQSLKSTTTWARRWGWSRRKAHRFLQMLKKEDMVELENARVTSRVTICNYERYQTRRNDCETATERKRNDGGTTKRTDNNYKNVNKEKNGNGPASRFSSLKSFSQMDCERAAAAFEEAAKEFINDERSSAS